MLVVVQEQIQYVRNEDIDRDMVTYNKVKNQIDEEYSSLKSTLTDLTIKAQKIISEDRSKAFKYESISFVSLYYEKCVSIILKLFRIIFEVNMKPEIESKLKIILKWSKGINIFKEEAKLDQSYIIPNDIYEQDIELCKIPTQTLKKIKELEKSMHEMSKAIIIYKKVNSICFNRLINIVFDVI